MAPDQIGSRPFRKFALTKRVVGALFGLSNKLEALGDFAVGIPKVGPQLVGSRKRLPTRVFLENRPFAGARDITGARVQYGRVPERTCKQGDVPRTKGVGFERVVQRRVEVAR